MLFDLAGWCFVSFDGGDFFGMYIHQPSFRALPFSTVIIVFMHLITIAIKQGIPIRMSLEHAVNDIESQLPCKQSANDEKREMENDTSLNPICNNDVQPQYINPSLRLQKILFEPMNDPQRPFIVPFFR